MASRLDKKLWNIRFVTLLAIDTCFQMAIYLINPIIAGYAVALGSTLAVGGFIAGINSSTSMVMRAFTGWIADKFNKPSLLVLSAAVFFVSALGCALAPNVVVLGLFRVLQGVAFTLRTTTVVALVSLVVDKDYIGRGVGWVGTSSSISCAVAPSIASLLVNSYGFVPCFVLSSLVFFIGFVLTVLFKTRSGVSTVPISHSANAEKSDNVRVENHSSEGLKKLFYVAAIPYSIIAALSGAAYAVAIAMIFLVGQYRGFEGASLFFVAYAVAAFVSKPIVGKISDSKSLTLAIVPTMLMELLGAIVLVFMFSAWFALLAGALIGIGQGSSYSALQAESVRGVDSQHMGRAINTFYIGPDINMGFSPLIAGILMQNWGPTTMLWFCVATTTVALVMFLLMRKKLAKPRS